MKKAYLQNNIPNCLPNYQMVYVHKIRDNIAIISSDNEHKVAVSTDRLFDCLPTLDGHSDPMSIENLS